MFIDAASWGDTPYDGLARSDQSERVLEMDTAA